MRVLLSYSQNRGVIHSGYVWLSNAIETSALPASHASARDYCNYLNVILNPDVHRELLVNKFRSGICWSHSSTVGGETGGA
jgi:hypothetical protein